MGCLLHSRCYLQHAGFTVVELITAILLLAILSGVALSNFVSPSAFIPATFAHQLRLEMNLAQSIATARQDSTIRLELRAHPERWEIRTLSSTQGQVGASFIDTANSTIAIANGSIRQSITATTPLQIDYSGTGGIARASLASSPLDPDLGVQIDVAGDSTRSLCLYPSGYLDARPCT